MKLKKIKSAESRLPLKFKVWIYFVMFTLVVFMLLWLFQILFLQQFYERMKVHGASQSAEQIVSSFNGLRDENFYDVISEVAVKNDLCIEVLDEYS